MRIKTQVPMAILLILTVFSVSLFGYTLYEILMIRWATKCIEVSVRDVSFTINSVQPCINFNLVLKNNVNTYLGLTYISIDVYLNNTKVTYKSIERGYSNPVDLPVGVNTVLEFSANVTKFPGSNRPSWKFKIFIIFATRLIQQASVSRWVSYE